jgi:hypothetical protein
MIQKVKLHIKNPQKQLNKPLIIHLIIAIIEEDETIKNSLNHAD